MKSETRCEIVKLEQATSYNATEWLNVTLKLWGCDGEVVLRRRASQAKAMKIGRWATMYVKFDPPKRTRRAKP